MTVATVTTVLAVPASAAVDPKGSTSRFIHIRNICTNEWTFKSRRLSYIAVGRYKGGATWKEWRGTVNCNPVTDNNSATFGWAPASTTSEVKLTMWINGDFAREMVVDADTNLCFTVTSGGSQLLTTSKAGFGGRGSCRI